MDERKGHYSPAQLGAFLKIQLVAGRQTNRGTFRSVAALKAMLPTAYARHVDFLVDEGDLIVGTDGSVYVDGWKEWQEGDLTVRDRMRALRGRRSEDRSERRPMPREISAGAERTAMWRLRNKVFERDNFTCRYCGSDDYPRGWLVVDHVIPAPDGPTVEENLVTACRPCNKRKGDRTPEQAGMPMLPAYASRNGKRHASL
jgi:5-methylcytosine-specific restriction endonuclease McrA